VFRAKITSSHGFEKVLVGTPSGVAGTVHGALLSVDLDLLRVRPDVDVEFTGRFEFLVH